jgi:hypothetical protein
MSQNKVTIPNSETGTWEDKDLSLISSRREKDETYIEFFNRYTTRIKKIEESLSAKEKEDAKSSNRNIEILAVFVTLFTFISIETQILRSGISFITAIGFSLLMLGSLIFFIFSLHFLIRSEKVLSEYVQFFLLLVIALLIIATGLFFVYKGEKSFLSDLDKKYYSKADADQKIMTQVNFILDTFKKCIVSNGTYWPCLK